MKQCLLHQSFLAHTKFYTIFPPQSWPFSIIVIVTVVIIVIIIIISIIIIIIIIISAA